MPSLSVYLPAEHAAEVSAAVESGEYENESQAVQAAVAEFYGVDA